MAQGSWVNLLGNPTLHAFPLTPPLALTARTEQGRAILEWEGNAARYLLLKSSSASDYAPLASLTTERRIVNEMPVSGAHSIAKKYMLARSSPPRKGCLPMWTHPGPHKLDLGGGDTILAPLRPPKHGRLKILPGGWHYLPEEGFGEVVDIDITASGTG